MNSLDVTLDADPQPGATWFWVMLDSITVVLAAIAALFYRFHLGPRAGIEELWRGSQFPGRSAWTLLALLGEFLAALIIVSRRFHLYTPTRITGYLHEQWLSLQACAIAGLLLSATFYLVHAQDISREVVLGTILLTAALLSVRRLVYRKSLYKRYARGVATHNVLIIGTGPEAHALRHYLESIPHLGYTFKGFIQIPGDAGPSNVTSSDVVGTVDTLSEQARRRFIDEIFFTAQCDRKIVQQVLEDVRHRGVGLRVVPDVYDGPAWSNAVEYIGQLPTVPLRRPEISELGLLIKRSFDIVFSALLLLCLLPLLLLVGALIRLDSPGPILYFSDRIGKKGHMFRCVKFRTMVADAEARRQHLLHMNERDEVLFKISHDPRITRLGHFLRKYSLDELPQFWNVLVGEMSVVGPRPPLASEVQKYKLDYLQRLKVAPGITGLWQVQGRRDSSFATYLSLDITYIENWSVWLDVKIIARTIGVVVAGTGS